MDEKLKPCPFCGGKAHTIEPARYGKSWGIRCECGAFLGFEQTEAEAVAAWNSRAAMEFDNWFYLPKPQEPLTKVTETRCKWDGTKAKVDMFYEVQDQAAASWAKELDKRTIKRICEVWNQDRTCERFWTGAEMICSECAYQLNDATVNYCPNCGAKVI